MLCDKGQRVQLANDKLHLPARHSHHKQPTPQANANLNRPHRRQTSTNLMRIPGITELTNKVKPTPPIPQNTQDPFTALKIQSALPNRLNTAALIAQLSEQIAQELGLSLVRLHLGPGQQPKLQILIERNHQSPTLDDCANFSKALSIQLDLHDPIPNQYLLEVSSPGDDRPLTNQNDFNKFSQHQIQIKYKNTQRKPQRATLQTLRQNTLTISSPNTTTPDTPDTPDIQEINLNEIREVRLVPQKPQPKPKRKPKNR
ncbi:MAG: hypothetical protein OD811_01755 [Alphaproteobacteria bacterium]